MDILNKFSPYAHWLVRLSLAATFLYHGPTKFPVAGGIAFMMGMPVFLIYLLATMETIGGILILWGGIGPDWATRVAGALFAIVMFGAIFMVHFSNGWDFMAGWGEGTNNMGGMEFQTLIAVVALYFLTHGNRVND
ncbi:MAG: DoxX family protein [FCB group bacterium]|nr:DoxX family protein [FCB group bacterium]